MNAEPSRTFPGRAREAVAPVPVRVVVALAAEAAPLVEAWMLDRHSGDAFVWFEGELPGARAPVQLVISGVGRARCAAAVGWIAGRDREPGERAVWLNVGIAGADRYAEGHAVNGGASSAEVGDVVLAAAVRDTSRARLLQGAEGSDGDTSTLRRALRVPCWYPPWLGRRPPEELKGRRGPRLVRSTIHTVDVPETTFDEAGVYEMEAAAFLECALPLSTSELVHVIKVVSDTPRTGLAVVDRGAVAALCTAAVPTVTRLAQEIGGWMPRSIVDDSSTRCEVWSDRLRLTVAQRRQFVRLVERVVALTPDGAEPLERVAEFLAQCEGEPNARRVRADGRRALKQMERWVDELALEAGGSGAAQKMSASPGESE